MLPGLGFLLMPPTVQTMLDNVNTAINKLMTGDAVQSYAIEGRQLSRYSLEGLLALRDRLQNDLAAAQGGATNYAEFDEPQ